MIERKALNFDRYRKVQAIKNNKKKWHVLKYTIPFQDRQKINKNFVLNATLIKKAK